MWDAATGTALTALLGHTLLVWSAAFSPDGSRIVTASEDKTARVWDANTGAVLATLSGHSGPVLSAAFSPDGSRVVTASMDHSVRVWNADTGAMVATLSGHASWVWTRIVQSRRFSRRHRIPRHDRARVGRDDRRRARHSSPGIRVRYSGRHSARTVLASSRHPWTTRREFGTPGKATRSLYSQGMRTR